MQRLNRLGLGQPDIPAKDRERRLPGNKLSMCGTAGRTLQCKSHGTMRATFHCNYALCPVCAPRRARKYQDAYAPLLKTVASRRGPSVRMMTLTQRDRDDEDFATAARRILDQWRKFLALLRTSYARELGVPRALGGVRSLEVAPRELLGWHAHLHCAIDHYVDGWAIRACWAAAGIDRRTADGEADAMEAAEWAREGFVLRNDGRSGQLNRHVRTWHVAQWAEWCQQRGLNSVVDVRAVPLSEVFKYICKAVDVEQKVYRRDDYDHVVGVTDEQLLELVQGMGRLRRVSAFGKLYGAIGRLEAELELEDKCPICDGELLEYFWHPKDQHHGRAPPLWRVRESCADLVWFGRKVRDSKQRGEQAFWLHAQHEQREELASARFGSVSSAERWEHCQSHAW